MPRVRRSFVSAVTTLVIVAVVLGLGGAGAAFGRPSRATAGPDRPRPVPRVVLSVVAFRRRFASESSASHTVRHGRRLPARGSTANTTRRLSAFSQCPPDGQDTSCGVLVTISDGGTTVATDSTQPPIDGIEDTLIGVQNDSSSTIGSLQLSSNTDLFGFDGDGLCSVSPHPSGCPFGPTGYEGLGTSFSNINPAKTGGVVTFTSGLAPGASAYFSLEEALTGAMIVTGGPSVSEQGGPPNPAEKRVTASAGCPVNCATGVFWHQWDDLRVPGRGVPLDFQRTYSSQQAAADGPLGFGWTDSYNMSLSFDQASNATVHQEDGSTVTFGPDGSGGYVAAPRVLATLVHNGDGTYTFTRNADFVHFNFSSAGLLMSEVDRNGYITALSYNGTQLASVTDPAGRTFSFSYNGSRIASVTGPGPRVESFTYDGAGNLQTATDPTLGVWQFTYDANHRLLTMTDPRNDGSLVNHYNAAGQVDSQTDMLGTRTTTWSYSGDPASPAGGTTTVTDPKGNVTTLNFANLELLSKTDATGTSYAATTSYVYDPATLGITQLTDPNNHTSTATYDTRGNQTSFQDALQRQTTATYNSFNEPLIVHDTTGVDTTRSYDANGNLLSVSRPVDATHTQVVTYHYDDLAHPGDATRITDPNGHDTALTYDSQGDLASITDAIGDKTTFVYDTLGERSSMVSARGNVAGADPNQYTTSYVYDALGRLTQTTDPLGHITKQTYDADGNVVSSTDGDNNLAQYSYDADNELTQITRTDGTLLKYGYDDNGNQTFQTDGANQPTSYGYDPLDRVASVTDPRNRTTQYGYDSAGNLTTLIDPSSRTTSYGYDAANELASVSYSDGTTPNVSFTYTADGLRQTMADGTGTTTYSYDEANRLTGQSNPTSGQSVGYGYDLNGNLTALTYPNGHIVSRGYDNADRLTGITDWLGHTTSFTPDPDSNTTAIGYANGITASSVFDHADQLSSITDKNGGGSTVASFAYSRDGNGQLTSTTPTGSGQGGNESYGYNSLNQLTTVNTSSYSYDAADNITQLTSGATLGYDNANELTSSTLGSTTTSYGYDSSGNRTSEHTNPLLTVSGNEISDAVRSANVQGDGRSAPDSSYGIWQATTNLETNGGFESGISGWKSKTVNPAALSWDQTRADAKFGGGSLKVVSSGTNNFEGAETNGTTLSASTTYTSSLWVKGAAGATLTFCVEENPSNSCHNNNFTASGAWQRLSQTFTTGSTTTGLTLELSTNGIQATSFWIDGAQIEAATVATPYVDTGGASASRAVALVQGPANLLSAGQGWVAVRARPEWSSSQPPSGGSGWEWLYDWRTDSANRYSLLWNESSRQFEFVRRINNSSAAVFSPVLTINPGDTHTVVAKWVNATSIAISVDGGSFTTTTISGSYTPSLTTFALGNNTPANEPFDGELLWTATGTGTLSNTDAATLNNLGNSDPTLAGLPGSASFAWAANTASYQTQTSSTSTYSYDQANRLTATTTPSGTSSYSYDGDGLRATATTGGSTKHFAWDLSGNLPLLLSDGSTSYLYDDTGSPIEQLDSSGTPLYYQHDQLGSTRLLTDQNGTSAATYVYDAYGNLSSHTGAADTPLRWNGQYQDGSSGLYYLRARYYDPATGQFISRDPISPITKAPYAYVGGDPLNTLDVDGLCCGWLTDNPVTNTLTSAYHGAESGFHAAAPYISVGAGFIGTGCAFASYVPVAEEVTLPCAAGFAGLKTLADADLAAHKQASWTNVGLDVAGLGASGASRALRTAEAQAARTFGLTLRAGLNPTKALTTLRTIRSWQSNLLPIEYLLTVGDTTQLVNELLEVRC
ncbi:MAG TPA: RHS repeat-associated core domain-containing protein [Gaiellaceae bacterium]|nr:RHS repeat-associated core domain-containing protein [Gaiellaceae bacterium]